jgi:predicted DNA-binding transcriptional regulator YafY
MVWVVNDFKECVFMANPKLKLLRILKILRETDETSPLTASEIGKKLALYGIEAERKSICRDINVLIDAGYDIQLCEDNKKGYFMASRKFEDYELKILIDAVWGARFLTYENSKLIAEKIKSLASSMGQKMLTEVTPIKSHVKSNNPAVKIYIDTILQAIKQKRKIQFQYTYTDRELKKQLRHDGFVYVLSPYSLVWENDRYYLIGNYDKYDNLSNYRLDRIKNLSILNDKLCCIRGLRGGEQLERVISCTRHFHFLNRWFAKHLIRFHQNIPSSIAAALSITGCRRGR